MKQITINGTIIFFYYRELIHKSPENQWCVHFPGSDASVVARTQRFFYETEQKRPIQYQEYLAKR